MTNCGKPTIEAFWATYAFVARLLQNDIMLLATMVMPPTECLELAPVIELNLLDITFVVRVFVIIQHSSLGFLEVWTPICFSGTM